ncbi:MAG: type II toxin-antitoxin system RelE/ParE family toxin [Acidobacteria bacterium]|nr:type II toxin-antitoxin system RelE/ParE family toxin [Acidobacteriota bacterium]
MARRTVEFHPEAIAEAHAAAEWYRQRSAGAADRFLEELDRAVEMIAGAPLRWLDYRHGTRRFLLRRFPFSVVYREAGGTLQVIAVAHARRKPGYWKVR